MTENRRTAKLKDLALRNPEDVKGGKAAPA